MRGTTEALRAVRAICETQPLNGWVTAALRAVVRARHLPPERVMRHLKRVGEVAAPLPDGRVLRLFSQRDDGVTQHVFWKGWDGFESESSGLFYRMARRARLTIDVGAYIGYYALLAAYANPRGAVHAFEPLERIWTRLEQNLARNRLGNLQAHKLALAERDGTADFYHCVTSSAPSSSGLSKEFLERLTGKAFVATPVKTVRLDRFLAERGLSGVDLVKMDTEGTEAVVLAGMTETLARDRPAIFCEVMPGGGTEPALEGLLAPHGYRYWLLTDRGPEPRARIEADPRFRNYLFATRPPDALG